MEKLTVEGKLRLEEVRKTLDDSGIKVIEKKDLLAATIEECRFEFSRDKLEVEFPSEKYSIVANVCLKVMNDSGFYSRLLKLIGDEELNRNHMQDNLINHLKTRKAALEYENVKLTEKLGKNEGVIAQQEKRLAELERKLNRYEKIDDGTLKEMIVAGIKEKSSFSVVEFSRKNEVREKQAGKCLRELIEDGIIVQSNGFVAVKTVPGIEFRVREYWERVWNGKRAE